MFQKPVKPLTHGIIDYVFSGVLLAVPSILGMSRGAATTYRVLAAPFLTVDALTDTPAGIRGLLPFRKHKMLDLGFLAGLSLLTFSKFIRKDKRVLRFHLGFLALAAGNYLLTDYRSKRG